MLITFVLGHARLDILCSNDLGHAIQYCLHLSSSFFSWPVLSPEMKGPGPFLPTGGRLSCRGMAGREHQYAIAYFHAYREWGIRWTLYLLYLSVDLSIPGSSADPIYFQFDHATPRQYWQRSLLSLVLLLVVVRIPEMLVQRHADFTFQDAPTILLIGHSPLSAFNDSLDQRFENVAQSGESYLHLL